LIETTRAFCGQIRSSFSAYLDGAIDGHRMQEIARHLEGSGDGPGCAECAGEFAAWRQMQELLALLGPAKPPADLGLKLRLAISREQSRRTSHMSDRLSLLWDNMLRPALLQVSVGIAGTVAVMGCLLLLVGVVAEPPQAVLANDEPLAVITAPHYLYSAVDPGAIVTSRDTTVVVEASVDQSGRVYDYDIVSGAEDAAEAATVRTQVANQLLGCVFRPASVFGLPVKGRVVMTFAGISVHG
jgi:anti-sigma factor RsiW